VPWLVWWILLAGLYLLLADSTNPRELVIGAVFAAVGATGAVLVRRQRKLLLKPRARWLRGAWRPLLGLFADLPKLARALPARGGQAAFAETSFERGDSEGEDAAARALTEALGSLAPNTIVVAVDERRGTALTHRLRP
jgi:hypothetical protein